ncbi:hypothetical protein BGZ65_011522, partial [Modicella reniformis]
MAVLTASVPTQVQGLPQSNDNFPRRFRNKFPLVLRQIVHKDVIEQWSSDPEHVTCCLNQSVYEQDQGLPQQQKQQQQAQQQLLSQGADSSPPTAQAASEAVQAHTQESLLPVMIAEDTKNFMDHPQFTKKISMTAREIAARVLVRPAWKGTTATDEVSAGNSADTANSDKNNNTTSQRFYYRGMVPSRLYSDLRISDLLNALSLPQETTAHESAPNRDLMRIWISLAGATTPLHYDRCHGILIQLVGRKRFVVFSHEDTSNLYTYDGISGPGHASKVRGLGHCFPFAFTAPSSTLQSL